MLNPLWLREMRQQARLGRTPWYLLAIALSLALLMASVGGVAAANRTDPAQLGEILFQIYFTLATFVVSVVGPAVAANGIASEREGKTWEAVLLTGLTPKEMVRGKFAAAMTTLALYIVFLAPVAALSFLFGGVTAMEVLLGFVVLAALAALAVAFGLAISSLMQSLRWAIVVTLILSVSAGPILFGLFGYGLSFAANQRWHDVPRAFPVWLPLAYTRVPFGLDYVGLLVIVPLFMLIIPVGLLYELSVANMSDDADDRSTGLKKWVTFSAVLLLLADGIVALSVRASDVVAASVVASVAYFFFILFASYLFLAEPAGPSQRVEIHWQRQHAGALRRFFGPTLMGTTALLFLLHLAGLALIASLGLLVSTRAGSSSPATASHEIGMVALVGHLLAFGVFVLGLNAWLRSRGHGTPWRSRLVSAGTVFLITISPWVVVAVGGVVTRGKEWLAVGAPSPLFALVMLDPSGKEDFMRAAGAAASLVWMVAGVTLLARAARNTSHVLGERRARLLSEESMLAAEADVGGPLPST